MNKAHNRTAWMGKCKPAGRFMKMLAILSLTGGILSAIPANALAVDYPHMDYSISKDTPTEGKVGRAIIIGNNLTNQGPEPVILYDVVMHIYGEIYSETFYTDIPLDTNVTIQPNETWTKNASFRPPFAAIYYYEIDFLEVYNLSGQYSFMQSSIGPSNALYIDVKKPTYDSFTSGQEVAGEPFPYACLPFLLLIGIWIAVLVLTLKTFIRGVIRNRGVLPKRKDR